MNVYTILLFLHVSGDIGLFIGLGIQLLSLATLRRVKRVEQARPIAGLIAITNPIGVISALLTIGTGLYMAFTVWSFRTSWIVVSLASMGLFLTPIIGLVIEPRTRAIVSATRQAPDGPIQETFYRMINDPVLGTALQTMAALLLGIVFLMTNKPPLVEAIITIAIALAAGLASAAPPWWGRGGKIRQKGDELL
jgi:hypothetical protein